MPKKIIYRTFEATNINLTTPVKIGELKFMIEGEPI
jgi:hypothetical protein